jgi:Zn-finger protein
MPHVYDCHETYLRHKDDPSTSILQRIINLSSLKTQRVVWIMMVIEKGSTRLSRDESYIGEEQAGVLTSRYQM